MTIWQKRIISRHLGLGMSLFGNIKTKTSRFLTRNSRQTLLASKSLCGGTHKSYWCPAVSIVDNDIFRVGQTQRLLYRSTPQSFSQWTPSLVISYLISSMLALLLAFIHKTLLPWLFLMHFRSFTCHFRTNIYIWHGITLSDPAKPKK